MISLRGLARAAGLLIGIPALALAIVLLVGATAQAIVEHDQKSRFPPPGQLVDIGGGEKIHLREWGTPNDKPTLLLFVSGYAPSSAWAWIGQDLATDYHLVAFDRPGMGWSSGGSGPRDAAHAADALSRALEIAGIRPPYVVLAHSFGGYSGRVFAAQRREDVDAIVLLDTSHPDVAGSGHGFLARMNALRAHVGLELLAPISGAYSSLPAGEGDAAIAVAGWTSHLDAAADELETWIQSTAQVHAADGFGDVPLLIVAGAQSEEQRRWQLDLQRLSSGSEFVALNVGHTDMLIQQDQAAQVTAELRRFLANVRP